MFRLYILQQYKPFTPMKGFLRLQSKTRLIAQIDQSNTLTESGSFAPSETSSDLHPVAANAHLQNLYYCARITIEYAQITPILN